jgi:hypothetical protein
MSSIIKTVLYSLALTLVLVAQGVFAEERPEFELISPLVFENEIVQLRGNFDPQNIASVSVERPQIWFEFGTSSSDLNFETPRKKQSSFRSIEITQGITGLHPNTIYYVQTAVKFNGETEKSDAVSFNSSQLTPINISTPINRVTDIYDPRNVPQMNTPIRVLTINPPINTFNPPINGGVISRSDLSLISPTLFFPKSKKVKDIEERERLVAAREVAFLEAEANQRLPRVGLARSNFDNSATNSDENGEIIIAARIKRFKNSGGAIGTASVINGLVGDIGGGTNYGTLLLIVLMLLAAVVLSHFTLFRKSFKWKNAYLRANPNIYNSRPNQTRTQPLVGQALLRKKYIHMNHNPATFPQFNQMNSAKV